MAGHWAPSVTISRRRTSALREQERSPVRKTFHNLERNLARKRNSRWWHHCRRSAASCATRYSGLFGSG